MKNRKLRPWVKITLATICFLCWWSVIWTKHVEAVNECLDGHTEQTQYQCF